jgi:hypothetical protein
MAEPDILGPNDEVSLTPISSMAMDAATRSEINMQVEFAMQHPRSITSVRKEVEELVTLDQSIAEESFYTLKRKDKDNNVKLIQGPSIRFAEVLCYCWGHTRSGIQIADVDGEFVTGEGAFMDLQRNNVIKIKTKRRITDKNGKRYNTDMIQTTGNAAASLAYRNAVTRLIPKAFWNDILEKAKLTAIGKNKSIGETRNIAIEYGKKIGVSEEQIFATLGIQGINDLGVDELIALKGLYNSVKDGESTLEDAFGDPFEKEINGLMDQLGWNKGRRDAVLPSYRGRSVELLAYLKKQAEPLSTGQPTSQQAEGKTSDSQPATKEEPQSRRRQPKKDTPPPQEKPVESQSEAVTESAEPPQVEVAQEPKEEVPKAEVKQQVATPGKFSF